MEKQKRIWNYKKTHWMSQTRIYTIFIWLLQRCNNKNNPSYDRYGGRWIKCEWNNFEEFYADMWTTYKNWLTIDRIDNNWNYCKENCRWATIEQQSYNRRNNNIIMLFWQKKPLIYWLLKMGIKRELYYYRIKRWMTPQNALLLPILQRWKPLKDRKFN